MRYQPIAIIINFARNYKRELNLNGTAPLSDAVMRCLPGKAHLINAVSDLIELTKM